MFAQYGLANTHLGVIIADSVLAVPFVVVNETASLQGIDHRLEHAAASMGACDYRFTQPTLAIRSSSSSYEAPRSANAIFDAHQVAFQTFAKRFERHVTSSPFVATVPLGPFDTAGQCVNVIQQLYELLVKHFPVCMLA